MFNQMTRTAFPVRHWSLVGHAGTGKSTFATQMQGPKLVIDADHRFSELLFRDSGVVYQLSETPSDNVDPERIHAILLKDMPGAGVRTIVVDSLTSIITPYVVQAMRDGEQGRLRSKMAGFQRKALAMRQLQDAVSRWGTNTLWIYHLQDAHDAQANAVVRSTVSQTEVARLTRSLNVQLQIVVDGQRRGIHVAWARRGRSGMTLWDESGCWQDMPARIEAAIYDGLSPAQQDAIARRCPTVFPSMEHALSWGVEQGAFASIEAARRCYVALKSDTAPKTAQEMASLWVTEVRMRKA